MKNVSVVPRGYDCKGIGNFWGDRMVLYPDCNGGFTNLLYTPKKSVLLHDNFKNKKELSI